MPRWRFWQQPEQAPATPTTPPPVGRFNLRPRQDVIGGGLNAATGDRDALAKLRQRRETVVFDLEKAESANLPENAWTERVALIDETLGLIAAERETVVSAREPAGEPWPASPITNITVVLEPSPKVHFAIGGESFLYVEEIDWAERGFQLARVDLSRETGDPARLVPEGWPPAARTAAEDHLDASLFAFATSLRDAALAGSALPIGTLADLATPDTEHGGWRLWNGPSPAAEAKARRLRELDAEAARLHDERAQELAERDRWADRLPIARRRLSELDAEIDRLLESSAQ